MNKFQLQLALAREGYKFYTNIPTLKKNTLITKLQGEGKKVSGFAHAGGNFAVYVKEAK